MSKQRLEGKVAIITGAASGIGEATARIFTTHGALVVIADIQDELGAGVVASIGPGKCKYKRCDVRNEKEVEELVDFTIKAYGRLDIMFSNAGISEKLTSTILDVDFAVLDNVIAVNVRGVAATIKHAARAMVASGTRGSIICTASIAVTKGGFGPAVYTASKLAVVGLVRSAAAELGRHGIRANCVSPGGVVTPLALSLCGWSQSQVEEFAGAMMVLKGGGPLKASDIGEAALFLASDESAFVTGQNLMVDGGVTAVGSRPASRVE
ncbi:short-chain dehydrogenase reductase 3a-like [Elaeis guineensis]|uniref:Short-chain dehydrogenase reductase 3a-like n=1 Tax=Elaeis guineensis var. tenera TaxID=51953 RepID=A0A6I9QM67_ELAGV|nr:short-chain dehydrogenase reductase 3a-like [Elaeis guineensis]